MAKIRITKTDPPNKTVIVAGKTPVGNDPLRDQMDARDHIISFIGQNYTGGKMTDDQQATFKNLSNLVGKDKAQQFLTHVAIFNQHPYVKDQPIAQKAQTFFDIGSHDPEIGALLTHYIALGQGIGAAINDSPWENVAALTGRNLPATNTPNPAADKIKLLVSNLNK